VYQLCELVNDNYMLVEEGIFYADDLPPKERTVLKSYVRTAVSDVASFPPRFAIFTLRFHEKSLLASDSRWRINLRIQSTI